MRLSTLFLLITWVPLIQLQLFHFNWNEHLKNTELLFLIFSLLSAVLAWLSVRSRRNDTVLYYSIRRFVFAFVASMIILGISVFLYKFLCVSTSVDPLKILLGYYVLLMAIGLLGVRQWRKLRKAENIYKSFTFIALSAVFFLISFAIPALLIHFSHNRGKGAQDKLESFLFIFLISSFLVPFLFWLYIEFRKRSTLSTFTRNSFLTVLFFFVLFGIPVLYVFAKIFNIRLYIYPNAWFHSSVPLFGLSTVLISVALSCAALFLTWKEARKDDRPYRTALKFILASVFVTWQLNLGLHLYYEIPSSVGRLWRFSNEWLGFYDGAAIVRSGVLIGYLAINLLFFGYIFFKEKFKDRPVLFFPTAGLSMVLSTYLIIPCMVMAGQLIPPYENYFILMITLSFITVIGPILMIALLFACFGFVLSFFKKGRGHTVFPLAVRKRGFAAALITVILYMFLFGAVWPVKEPAMDVLMGLMEKDKEQFWEVHGWEYGDIYHASYFEFFLFGKGAVRSLVNNLKKDDEFVKNASISLLGFIGDKRAVEPLIESLKDKSTQVRAALTLAGMDDKRAVSPSLTYFNEKELLPDAIPALGRLGGYCAIDSLLERLDDEDPEIRKSIANALGHFHDTRAAEALFERLINDESDNVRWEISRVLQTMLGMRVPSFNSDIEKMKEWWLEWWSQNRDKVEIIFMDERERKGLNSQ